MPRLVDLQKTSAPTSFADDILPHTTVLQDDEILVSDVRGALRPTEFVERKLQVAMQRPPTWDVELQG